MRKLKFIAWDTQTKTLKRLGKVELVKGELTLKDHIILQFTGHLDKFGKEIYDHDVLLSNGEKKSMVVYSNNDNTWRLEEEGITKTFDTKFIATTTRLYNFYEKS